MSGGQCTLLTFSTDLSKGVGAMIGDIGYPLLLVVALVGGLIYSATTYGRRDRKEDQP